MNKQATSIFHNKIKFVIVLIWLVLSMAFTGCSSSIKKENEDLKPNFITKSAFLLNTEVTINLYDKQEEEILDECMKLIKDYERIYSRTDETSELYSLNNRTAPHVGLTYQISDDLSDIVKYGLYYSKLSEGAFDITIAPITSLWNFTSPTPMLPTEEALQAALPLVDYKNINLLQNEITFAKDGVQIDLGAIAKGYIADKVKDYLLSRGVTSAMINLGGNVLCVGEKPDGTPFHVGIQKPYADRNETIAIMNINDLSVVSSGIYERFFTLNGKSYHHILNPETGYPYKNNLLSVTIISPKSTDGDGLSTTCFALGLDKGLELINSLSDIHAIFITDDYQIHYSKGFEDAITLTSE